MSRAVHERVFDSMENAFSHGSTFAPNELAMAAGLATLAELDEQGLVERAAALGAAAARADRGRSSSATRSCARCAGSA